MKKSLFFICLFFSFFLNAQDDLLKILIDDNDPVYISYLFKGTKIVNAQSVELTREGMLQFDIQHRFGPINSGLYNLYGLDFSQVRLGLDYGLRDWITIGVGRSSALKIIDANSKIRIKRQVENGFPFVIVFNSSVYMKKWRYVEAQSEYFLFTDQLTYTNQLLIARKISRNLTIQFSPTIVHYNLVDSVIGANDKYSLGFGVRQKLTKRVSLNGEYFYQLNDKRNNNVFSLGFDIETGGHVFQLHLSNSPAMVEPYFITKTEGDWLTGDIYFGFNISRVFVIDN